jgi:hypothetical protein
VVSAVQKLRKSAGLAPSDRVEMFFEVTNVGADEAESYRLIEESLSVHKASVYKRLKQMPLSHVHRSPHALLIGKETLEEPDICKGSFVVYLTQPQLSVDMVALTELTGITQSANMLRMALCTMDFAKVEACPSMSLTLDGSTYTLQLGKHYFPTAAAKLGLTT